MIPKVIHYCWFGGKPLPKKAKKCIDSWRKYCPDFEIIEWNEGNYDVSATPYTRYCLEKKRWAFLSDYARLSIVYEYGGVYFDTDVELVSPLDALLEHSAFFAFENNDHVATGLGFGAEAGSPFVKAMMEQYAFSAEEDVQVRMCPALNTQALIPFGLRLDGSLQNLDGALILPQDYMNPYDDPTGRLNVTENTVSIHWYSKSALSRKAILRSRLTRPFHRLFGVDCFEWIKRMF